MGLPLKGHNPDDDDDDDDVDDDDDDDGESYPSPAKGITLC